MAMNPLQGGVRADRVRHASHLGVANDAVVVHEQVTPVRFFSGNFHRVAALAVAEFAATVLAFYAATLVRFPEAGLAGLEFAQGPAAWVRALVVASIFLVGLSSMGLYQLRQRARYTGVVGRVLVGVLFAEASLGVLFYLVPDMAVGRGVVLTTGALAFAQFALIRYAFAKLVDQDVFKRRILVWGAGERAAIIASRLRRRADQRGFKVVGYVSALGDSLRIPSEQLVQREANLLRFALRERIDEVVVAMDDRRRGFPEAFLRECRLRGIAVCDIVAFLERETGRVTVELAEPSWLIYSRGFRNDLVRSALKRLFDIAVALVALVLAAPIGLLAAVAIWLEDRGPILYRQLRTGQNGRPFHILKFRSMRVDAERDGQAVWAGENDSRVTRVGAFMRRTRIDELPQVLNVLAGRMSLVGPRPERPEFVAELSRTVPFYAERHFAKPGITGWAQIRFSYGASEEDAREKLGYDLYYVAHHSFLFDLMVLLQTVEVVLLRLGSR